MFPRHQPTVLDRTVGLSALRDAVHRGGETAKQIRVEGLERFTKSGVCEAEELTTSADLASQTIIIDAIQAHFPSVVIVAEEQSEHVIEREDYFVIDPVDGTNCFAGGGAEWGVTACYIERNIPTIGVIESPEIHGQGYAVRGQGAWLNERPLKLIPSSARQIVSPIGPWTPSWIREGVIPDLERQGFVVTGVPSALEGAFRFLRGEATLFLGGAEKVWDIAAAAVITEMAGGVVADFAGNQPAWKTIFTPTILGTNYEQLRPVIDAIRRNNPTSG